MLYFWLKAADEDVDLKIVSLQEQGLLGNVRVEADWQTGKKYISFHGDFPNPVSEIPNFPVELIEKVTFKDRIYCGFRTEGIYRHDGATLMMRTEVAIHSEIGHAAEREFWQDISVSAPNVVALAAIYSLVRQGMLAPEENWEQPAPAKSTSRRRFFGLRRG